MDSTRPGEGPCRAHTRTVGPAEQVRGGMGPQVERDLVPLDVVRSRSRHNVEGGVTPKEQFGPLEVGAASGHRVPHVRPTERRSLAAGRPSGGLNLWTRVKCVQPTTASMSTRLGQNPTLGRRNPRLMLAYRIAYKCRPSVQACRWPRMLLEPS
jgi:hypothetical protein